MSGIKLVQNGVVLASGSSSHPPPITLDVGIVCYLSFVGTPVPLRYTWSLTRPTGSQSTISSSNSPGPSFVPDIDGGAYSVLLTDENGNAYQLDIVTPTQPVSGGSNGAVTAVTTRAGQRLVSGTAAGQILQVACYATQGDGGGGPHAWRVGSPPSDDDGVAIVPTGSLNGWWARIYAGPVHAEWYGIFFDGDDTRATSNRLRFNAMVAANLTGAHFVFGDKTGRYMAVDYDASDPTNPRCLIVDNATGCRFSGQGRSTLIKYVGATPPDPGATWYSSACLAVIRGDFTSNCVFENFTIEANSKAHVGFWARNSWLFADWYNVTCQGASGVGMIIGRGNPGASSTNLDGPSLYKCNIGYNGNGADPGTGRGGLRICDGNTNNTSVAECVIGVNGPANPLGGGIGSSNTDGFGIEISLYPRSTVLRNNQMFTNGARDIYVRKEFSTSLTIEEATHELYQGPILEVETGATGVHATGTIILRNVNTTYNFRAQASQAFTFNAATDVFTANAHGYSNGDAVTLANTGGALPTGYGGTTLYYVIAVTANTFQLALTAGGAAVNGTTNGTGTNYVRKPYKIVDDKSPCTLILEGCRFQGPRGNFDAAGNVGVYDVAAVAGISKSMTNGAGGSYALHFVGTVQQYNGAQVQLGGDVEAEGWLETGTFTTAPIASRVFYQRRLSNIGPGANEKVVLQQDSDKLLVTCTPEALVNARAITPSSCVATGAIGGTTITGTSLACTSGIECSTATSRCKIGQIAGAYAGMWVGIASGSETTGNAAFLSNGSTESLMQSPGRCSMRVAGADVIACGSNTVAFFGATAAARQTITGSRGGNAALASLLTALALHGLIIDGSTP